MQRVFCLSIKTERWIIEKACTALLDKGSWNLSIWSTQDWKMKSRLTECTSGSNWQEQMCTRQSIDDWLKERRSKGSFHKKRGFWTWYYSWVHKVRGSLRRQFNPFPLMSKGEKWKTILPSMPKGEIVGNMTIAEKMQNVKVVIDGNRLWQKKLDDDREISKQSNEG